MDDRRPLYGVAALFLVNGVVFGSWLPRIPEIRDRLGLGLDDLGLVLAVGGLGGLLGSALSGRLVGRIGARHSALWPAVALLLLLPGIGLAPNVVVLAVVLAALGVSDALADVGMNALAVRQQELRGRSIFTRLHALWSIGSLGGAGASTVAAALQISLLTQLLVTALAGLLVVIGAAFTHPPTELRPRLPSRPRLVLGVALAGAAVALVEGAPHEWGAVYLTDRLTVSPALASFGFVILTSGMIAGRIGGDRFVDAIGPRRAIGTGLALVAVGVVLSMTVPVVGVVLAGYALWGLGISVVLPLLYRLAGSHREFGEGSGLAALTVGSRIGFLTGPTLVGTTAAASSLPLAIGTVVGVALVVSVMAVFRALGD